MEMFEQAAREKLRFLSHKGELTVEQVWDLPLESKDGNDLDTVAKAADRALQSCTKSFVSRSPRKSAELLELKLAIVKHIIAVKLKEEQDKLTAAGDAAERARLLEILHMKKERELVDLPIEEIERRLTQVDEKIASRGKGA